MELDLVTVWVVGITVTILVTGFKIYEKRSGKKVPTVFAQWTAFVASGVIALISTVPVIPPIELGGDPTQIVSGLFQWVTDLIVAIGPFFTVATLVYTTLWKKLIEEWVPGAYRKVFKKPTVG